MQRINLRDFYPFADSTIIEVTDEVAEALCEAKRQERNHMERVRRNKAYYSLDQDNGKIEREVLCLSPSAEAEAECKQMKEEFYRALNSLPDKQARRVYAHYILGIPQVEIAKTEGVDMAAVCRSIQRGIASMKSFLEFLD